MKTIGTLASLQIGTPHRYGTPDAAEARHRPWETSFFRVPSAQPRWLYTTHLEGNVQADTKHHGQPGQAVLLYAAAHYPLWQRELDEPNIGPGGFGENFTVADLTEQTACIGDIYALGEAHIQVTGPRYPCWKISCRWDNAQLTDLVAQSGRTGWYCRVLQEGIVEPGMPIILVERPYPQWSVALVNDLGHRRNHDVQTAQALAACPLLADFWQKLVVRRAMGYPDED